MADLEKTLGENFCQEESKKNISDATEDVWETFKRDCKVYEFCHKYLKEKPEDMDDKILEDFDFYFTFRFGQTHIIPEGNYDDSL